MPNFEIITENMGHNMGRELPHFGVQKSLKVPLNKKPNTF